MLLVMRKANRWVHRSAVLVTLAIPLIAQEGKIRPKPTAQEWAALAALPDFTGVWEVTRSGPGARGSAQQGPQLTAKYADMLKAYQANPPQDSAAANCVPPGMPGVMTQPYPIEFLLTPGKVTIVIEAYMQVRHIYTDGRPLPEDPDLTFNGTSVGKWDKDTLVVDSVGFSPATTLGAGIHHSAKMRINERMRLVEPDLLEVVTTVEDPEALTKPLVRTGRFARHRDWVTAEYVCQENNRNSVDESGKAGINLQHQ
jgi:hypothetical protein